MEDQEFAERDPASGVDYSSILNAFVPSAEAAPKKPLPKKVIPVAAQVTTPVAQIPRDPMLQSADTAAEIQSILRGNNPNEGYKSSVNSKTTRNRTVTNPLLLNDYDIETVGGAIRNTPEWKQQAEGLGDLEHLIALNAQREAKKTHVDLSPLGAYVDYQNSQMGHPTNLAANLKGTPQEETSLKEMGEIQRRRADMAKELINTIKASKMGQIVTQEGGQSGFSAGVSPSAMAMQRAHLGLQGVEQLKKATDSAFKDNDEQLKAINVIAQRIANSKVNPSEGGSIPALLEVMDTGSKRILAGVLNMEGYDPSISGQFKAGLQKYIHGTTVEEQRGYLLDRLKQAAIRAREERDAKADDLRQYARSLPVNPFDVQNIVESRYKMSDKGYKTAAETSRGEAKPKDEQSEFQKFQQMMEAHDKGKK